MKISVVCAIGWLDSHGYQYVCRECIGSMAEFADVVYLVSPPGTGTAWTS